MNGPGSTSLFQLTDFEPTGNPVCFLPGTLIATPNGEVAVETLAIGYLVTTADGRAVPVRWVGRQTLSTLFGPPERLMPVRVRQGALGEGLPRRDLTLTADHALLVDDLLINAGALVNGGSIDWVPLSELGARFTVYHVETEDHDLILAEGAPAETFIDYVGRQVFDNYAEYVALYGEERIITEAPYPRISTPRLLPPALKARLGIGKAA
ncbi:Hint domain-containing protein [Roseibacterium sp. KMU-115]|uniref:Hint domain-containing protein n=2 Tax=Roseicyclus persicicus TaxID=2650661 RepID=A0A7X6GYJ4_9RHOB|nr:Hint domain-containing protein [Roseibacterium persicicum]